MVFNSRHSPPSATVKLVRLLRDDLYHPAGDILALEPEHILPHKHEILELGDPNVEPLAELVKQLAERVAALEAKGGQTRNSGKARESCRHDLIGAHRCDFS
jgi:hypothetical protein